MRIALAHEAHVAQVSVELPRKRPVRAGSGGHHPEAGEAAPVDRSRKRLLQRIHARKPARLLVHVPHPDDEQEGERRGGDRDWRGLSPSLGQQPREPRAAEHADHRGRRQVETRDPEVAERGHHDDAGDPHDGAGAEHRDDPLAPAPGDRHRRAGEQPQRQRDRGQRPAGRVALDPEVDSHRPARARAAAAVERVAGADPVRDVPEHGQRHEQSDHQAPLLRPADPQPDREQAEERPGLRPREADGPAEHPRRAHPPGQGALDS